MAWLNTAPKAAGAGVRKTRIASLKGSGVEPAYPRLDAFAYLAGTLFELGPVMVAGDGKAPLSHAEILAWQRNTGTRLTPWEAATLRALSGEYLAASADAASPDCPPPWRDSADAARLKAASIQASLAIFLD